MEFTLCMFAALFSFGYRSGEPFDLTRSGLGSRSHCINLAAQLRQPFATVGSSPIGRGNPLLLKKQRLFGIKAPSLCCCEYLASCFNLAAKFKLLFAQQPRFGIDLLWVATCCLLLGFGLQITHPLGSKLNQPMEALAQTT